MFSPNRKCRIQLSSGQTNLYGKPIPGVWITEGCSVVRLTITNEKSSVRADSSGSRGNARELQAQVVVLLTAKTKANVDDILELDGYQLRIMGKEPRRDVTGRLDHYQVSAEMWKTV